MGIGLKQLKRDDALEGDAIRFNAVTEEWEARSLEDSAETLHRLIITTWGGIVYDTDGELVLKET